MTLDKVMSSMAHSEETPVAGMHVGMLQRMEESHCSICPSFGFSQVSEDVSIIYFVECGKMGISELPSGPSDKCHFVSCKVT